ncbi:hypothetical protein ACFE04_002873 [Oxalis oulophora]
MDEKESTLSISQGDSAETDSPPPVSALMPTLPPPPPPLQMMSFMPLSTTTTTEAATPITTGGDLLGKKKRGRPRKYDSDGNLRIKTTPSSSMTSPFTVTSAQSSGFTLSPSDQFSNTTTAISSSSTAVRGKSKPPQAAASGGNGNGNLQLLSSLGEVFVKTAGADFTPHLVTVNAGEDVTGKIISFSQRGSRGVCVLSANGIVSNVTIRQPGSSGGVLTYEGRFDILKLSGCITVNDNGGVQSRNGCFTVSLAGPDGRVIGGGVAGYLIAASPIQIVVGSFKPHGYMVHKKKFYRERATQSPSLLLGMTSSGTISQPKPNGENTLNFTGQHHGVPDNNTDEDIKPVTNSVSTHDAAVWPGMNSNAIRRPHPDINVTVPTD